MGNEILNLLSLCLEAKKCGHNVFFYYSPHVSNIDIWKYQNTPNANDKLVTDFKISFYLDSDTETVMKNIEVAKNTIENLIGGNSNV